MQSDLTVHRRVDEPLVYDDGDDEFEDSQANKYLLFNIGKEVYGIDIGYIIEIIELQKITQVPDMPEYIKGVINLRGKIIPAMDMRLRFRIEERSYDDRNCIVIVKVSDRLVGLVVDTVEEVQDIPATNIDPAPAFKAEERKDKFISGLARTGEHVRIILDVEKIAFLENHPVTGQVEKEVSNEN